MQKVSDVIQNTPHFHMQKKHIVKKSKSNTAVQCKSMAKDKRHENDSATKKLTKMDECLTAHVLVGKQTLIFLYSL
jgi:hypothetical protein